MQFGTRGSEVQILSPRPNFQITYSRSPILMEAAWF
jgi:hypothetical protein